MNNDDSDINTHFNEIFDNNNVDIYYNTSGSNCGDGKCDNDK